jgi:hypothetical protein
MNNYITNDSRDASDSIKGFIYQIHLTLLRWLELRPGQALELERGEDIDTVTSSLKSGWQGLVTLLERRNEQVKAVNSPISLASKVSKEAFANFAKARKDNPNCELYFRFTTTATPVVEKRNKLSDKTPGIERWEQLRRGEIDPAHQIQLLVGVRSILLGLTRPTKFNKETWEAWREFIENADDSDLLLFIQRFEWSCGAEGLKDLHENVICAISKHTGWGRPLAVQLYRKILTHVALLLSSKDLKRLTPEALQGFIDNPILDPSEEALLGNLQLLVRGLNDLYALLQPKQNTIVSLKIDISPTTRIVHMVEEPAPGTEVPSTDDFKYADTPEGEIARLSAARMLLTGETFKTTIGTVQLPELYIAKSMLPEGTPVEFSIVFAEPSPEQYIKLEFRNLDADAQNGNLCFTYDFMRLTNKQEGLAGVLFGNDEDGKELGLRIGLAVFRRKDDGRRYELGFDFQIQTPMDIQSLSKALKLQDCLSHPCSIALVDLRKPEVPLTFRLEASTMSPPSPTLRASVEVLAQVAQKMGMSLIWPKRKVTPLEAETIHKLDSILRTGTWSIARNQSTEVTLLGGQAFRQASESARSSSRLGLWLPSDQDSVDIFGVKLPLGKVAYEYLADDLVLVRYLDWITADAEAKGSKDKQADVTKV